MLAIRLSNVTANVKSCINEIHEIECVAKFCVHEINSINNLYLVKSLRPSTHEFLGSSEIAKENDESLRQIWQIIRCPHSGTHVSYRFYGGLA